MQICYKNDQVKSCTRSTGDCVECRPGKGITVEKMTLHHLTDLSGRINTDIFELNGIIDELLNLAENSKLGHKNMRFLLDQIIRLSKVKAEIFNNGNTVYFNLMANNILDDEVAE